MSNYIPSFQTFFELLLLTAKKGVQTLFCPCSFADVHLRFVFHCRMLPTPNFALLFPMAAARLTGTGGRVVATITLLSFLSLSLSLSLSLQLAITLALITIITLTIITLHSALGTRHCCVPEAAFSKKKKKKNL